jgi:hypothetical protein
MRGLCDQRPPELLPVDEVQQVSCFLYHGQPQEAAAVEVKA